MYTKRVLMEGITREFEILKHLGSKVTKKNADFRFSEPQRSIEELEHYIVSSLPAQVFISNFSSLLACSDHVLRARIVGCFIFGASVHEFSWCSRKAHLFLPSWRASRESFGLRVFCLDPWWASEIVNSWDRCCKNQVGADRYPLRSSGSSSSYSEHQKHGSMSRFHKKCSLDSKYRIFDCKAFTGRFMEIDNRVCR